MLRHDPDLGAPRDERRPSVDASPYVSQRPGAGPTLPIARNPSAPIALDDFSADEEETHGAPSAPFYNLSQQRSQSRLYSPMRARPAPQNASSSHFVVMVPPADLPTESLPARSATIASHARRGILLPLYPTLGGQLYALAREYGLPSIGGISLYLLEDGQGGGGPRVGDATWAALWSAFFDEADEFDEPPPATARDNSDADFQRPSPLPYARRNVPLSPRRGLPRMPSNASFSSQRSASAASFALETGRLPIVGRFEWAVDPQRARWWRSFIGQGGEQDSERAEPASAPLPARSLSGSGPKPLRLNSQLSPGAVRRAAPRELPHVPDSGPPSAPYTDAINAPFSDAPKPAEPASADAVLGTPFGNDEPSTSRAELPSERAPSNASVRERVPSGASARDERAPSALSARDERVPSALSARDERVPSALAKRDERVPSALSTRDETQDETHAPKEHHTMSSTVASLSAAAQRFFGGRPQEDKRRSDDLAPARPAFAEPVEKPQTPTSPTRDVEAARERVTEMERHSAQARRHAPRASVEVPKSVRRASARISEAVSNRPPATSTPPPESYAQEPEAPQDERTDAAPADDTDDEQLHGLRSTTAAARSGRLHKSPAPSERGQVGQHSIARKSIVRPPSRPTEGDIFGTAPEGVSSAENAQRRMGHQKGDSLRSPIVLGTQLPDAPKSEPQLDPVQLSRQSSVEFDNTLGDLQRALELLSPRQRSRASYVPRSSALARGPSFGSGSVDAPDPGPPTSRRLFADEGNNAEVVPGLSPSAPVSEMRDGDATRESRPLSTGTPAYVRYGIADASTSSVIDKQPVDPRHAARFSQDQWSQDSHHISLQMPAMRGAADAPSGAYTVPEVQPLNVPRRSELLDSRDDDAADSVGAAMQLDALDESMTQSEVTHDAPPPLPPKDTHDEPLENVLQGMNQSRAENAYAPRGEDEWAQWSAGASVAQPEPPAPAPALRVAEDAEQYVPESSVRMSADAQQYVRVSEEHYIRPGGGGAPPMETLQNAPTRETTAAEAQEVLTGPAPNSAPSDAPFAFPAQGAPTDRLPERSVRERDEASWASEQGALHTPQPEQGALHTPQPSQGALHTPQPGQGAAMLAPQPVQGSPMHAQGQQTSPMLAQPQSSPLHAGPSDFSPNPSEIPSGGRFTPPSEPQVMSVMSPMSPNASKQSTFSMSSRSPRRLRHSASSDRLNTASSPNGARGFLAKMSPKLKWGRKKKGEERKVPSVSAPIAAMPLPTSDEYSDAEANARLSTASVSSVSKGRGTTRSGVPYFDPTTLVRSPNLGGGEAEYGQPNPVFRMNGASASLPTLLQNSPGNEPSAMQLRSPFSTGPNDADNSGVFPGNADIPSPELHQSALNTGQWGMQPQQPERWDAQPSVNTEVPAMPPSHSFSFDDPQHSVPLPSQYVAQQQAESRNAQQQAAEPRSAQEPWQEQGFGQTPRDAAPSHGADAINAPGNYGSGVVHPVNTAGATPAVAQGLSTGASNAAVAGSDAVGQAGHARAPNTMTSVEAPGQYAQDGAGMGSSALRSAENAGQRAADSTGSSGHRKMDSVSSVGRGALNSVTTMGPNASGSGALGASSNIGSGALDTASDAGRGAFDTAGQAGSGALGAADNAGRGAFDAAGNAGRGAFDTAGNVGDGAFETAGNVGGGALNTAGNVGRGTFDTVGNVGGGAFNSAGNAGGDVLGAAGNVGRGSFDTAGNIGRGSFDTAGNVGRGNLGTAGNLGQGAFDTAGNVGSGAFNTAGNVGSGAMSTAGNVGSGAFNTAGNVGSGAFNTAGNVGSGAFNTAGNAGSDAFNTAGNVGSGAFNTAGNAGSGAFNTAGNLGSGAFNTAGNAGSGAFNTAGNLGSGAFDTAGNLGGGAMSSAGNLGGGAVNTAGNVGSGAFNTAGNLGQGAFSTAGNLGGGAMNTAGNVGSGAFDTAGHLGGGATNAAGNLGQGAFGAVGDTGRGAFDTAGNLGGSAFNAVGNAGSGVMGTAGHLGGGAMDAVGHAGRGGMHGIGQLGQGATNAAGHTGHGVFNGAQNAMHSVEDGASSFAKKIPGMDKLPGSGGKESGGKGLFNSLTAGSFRKG